MVRGTGQDKRKTWDGIPIEMPSVAVLGPPTQEKMYKAINALSIGLLLRLELIRNCAPCESDDATAARA